MPLVPADYPDRLARAGLRVHVMGDWWTNGGSADQRAVVFHWTASGASSTPANDAEYCAHTAQYAPDYNVLCDRYGEVWVLAREKANSSGDISSVALNEALRGATDWRSAASRGLQDDTSANASLFAISAQNNGTGEAWSGPLVHAMATVAAVTLPLLGLDRSGYVTHHAALTRRKIDLTAGTGGCPDGGTWNALITDALHGGSAPQPVEDEVWVLNAELPAPVDGKVGHVHVALPYGYKSARVDLWLDCPHDDGAGLWGSQQYEGGAGGVGLWNNGNTWELWLPGKQRKYTSAAISGTSIACVALQNRGPRGPVYVTVSGT